MTYLLTNVSKFYSKMWEFRESGQFTDVTMKCEDGATFKCHRLALVAASDYFNAMFSGSFRERVCEEIVLGEVNGATFKEVLRFIYTGDVQVDLTNVYDLLRASEYFNLSDMQDMCISFVEQKKVCFTIQEFLHIYLYAYATKIDALTNALEPHFVNQFEIFSRADEFLEISFDLLNTLVSSRLASSTLPSADEIILGAITRWTSYRRQERLQHVNQLVKLITFENVSSEFLRVMVTNLLASIDAVLPRFTSSVGHADVPALQRSPNVHMYVRYALENLIRIFSFETPRNYSLCGEIFVNEPAHHTFRTVAFNDFFLYRLNYFSQKNLTEVDTKERTFYAHTSADMGLSLPLKRPPIVFQEVDLCPMRHNIYAYNRSLGRSVIRTAVNSTTNSNTFNDEEIARGIYAYNCEVEDWFAVPKMKKALEYSGMTSFNNILYLVGGNASTVVDPMKYVQAYDPRVAEWLELPKTQNDYVDASCCAYDGKIYVYGGLQTTACERYDSVAGKWESIWSLVNETNSMSFHAVTFSPNIWLVNQSRILESSGAGSPSNFQVNDSRFDQHLRRTVGWSPFSPHSEQFVCQIPMKPTNIVDCVVFEKL